MLEELENIDDDCEVYGINFVKIQDHNLAKRYGIKNYPALVYFRNGNPLIYDGDLRNEELVFEWLIEDENRELADEIEDVNSKMLEKLINDKPFLAVLFYAKECSECEEAIQALEVRTRSSEIAGATNCLRCRTLTTKRTFSALILSKVCWRFPWDMLWCKMSISVNDMTANNKYGIQTLPTLAFFRKQQTFMVFEGDLTNEEEVLKWLTSNDVFNVQDEIEEVNRKMLEKILNDNDFVAVYFCKLFWLKIKRIR